jgi:hypothetical protein
VKVKVRLISLLAAAGIAIACASAAPANAETKSISKGYTYATGSTKHTVSVSATSSISSSWTGYQTAKVSAVNARIARYSSSMAAAKQLRVDPNVKITGLNTNISTTGAGSFSEYSSGCSRGAFYSSANATVLYFYESSVVCTGGSVDLFQIDVSNSGAAYVGSTWYSYTVHAYHY